jgi:hypothetical protein
MSALVTAAMTIMQEMWLVERPDDDEQNCD